MGEIPDWYPLILAAKYLGVPPWELARQPLFWTEVALAAQDAESRYRRHREQPRSSGR